MQTCLVLRTSAGSARTGANITSSSFSLSSTPTLTHSHSAQHHTGRSPREEVLHTRKFSHAATRRSQPLSEADQPARERIFVLLQKATSLLPRTLSNSESTAKPESSQFWGDVLERANTDLSSGSSQVPSKATIAVCGFDKWARSTELVTAVLEDPFSSDPTYVDLLRNRWKNAPSCVNIEYGKPTAFAGSLYSPSSWLQQFPHPIQLTELPDLSSLSAISIETDSLLLSSDVLLLLCDPLVTSLSDLTNRAKHLLDRPNTILVLTSCSDSEEHHRFISQSLSKLGCRPGHILFVDPRRALNAVNTLQTNPTSPSSIDQYQRDSLGSRISTVTVAITDVLAPKDTSEIHSMNLKLRTALSQVYSALATSSRSLQGVEEDVDRIASRLDDLRSRIQHVRINAESDILGNTGKEDHVTQALSQGAKEINTLLGSLPFWKMVWRVDEIGTLVASAVRGQWCKELEAQLILHTGRLEPTQRDLSISAFSLISASSQSALRSSVLKNKLQQLAHSPTHPLTPNSLTQPIHDRRSQLIRYTTTKLHREAQSAVVAAFGGLFGGAGLGWWLAFGEHFLSLGIGTEMGTAIGSGALLAVGSIRWAVGKWERAKRRWMQDAGRVGEGLARDLKNTIQQTVDGKVVVLASTVCEGMQELIDRRRDEIRQLNGDLEQLEKEFHAYNHFPSTRTKRKPASPIDAE